MKIAFFYDKEPQSTLTMLGTGSRCYHVGFTDGEKLWDMNLLRRHQGAIEVRTGEREAHTRARQRRAHDQVRRDRHGDGWDRHE